MNALRKQQLIGHVGMIPEKIFEGGKKLANLHMTNESYKMTREKKWRKRNGID
jgi:hypothetical protein